MSSFDLYIHGTPKGHQIWGSSKNHDYISTFYSHDNLVNDRSALQIDIFKGDSFYTYIHQNDIYDYDDRPGAFFAITVSFSKSYCTNVYMLHKIFEAVYDQVCVGNIILQKQNKEKYLVSEFESSRSGNNATVDRVQAIFNKKIVELIEPFLQPLANISDTFDKQKKQISLLEVDSPLFFDFFKKQSIIVLPNLEPASIAKQKITEQLNAANARKKALESTNSQLQSKITALTMDNKDLSDQLHVSVSSSENKYSSTINQLKADLKSATQERDKLQVKIEGAKSLITHIYKSLTSLIDVINPEVNKTKIEEPYENSQKSGHLQKSHSKNSNKWNIGLNRNRKLIIVVVLFLVLGFFVGSLLIKCRTDVRAERVTDIAIVEKDDTDTIPHNTYDKWEDCVINIVEGGDEIYTEHQYKLEIKKKDYITDANVPQGYWVVIINNDTPPINKNEYFTVPGGTDANTNILIQYIVDNKDVISRTTKVK